jgi:hypothetical protein
MALVAVQRQLGGATRSGVGHRISGGLNRTAHRRRARPEHDEQEKDAEATDAKHDEQQTCGRTNDFRASFVVSGKSRLSDCGQSNLQKYQTGNYTK